MSRSNGGARGDRSSALWGTGGKGGEGRSNALWGSGGRGGESRSSALWGRRGRGPLLATIAALALVVPMGAAADGGDSGGGKSDRTYVAPGLLEGAERNPGQKIKVIISADKGSAVAKLAFRLAGESGGGGGVGSLKHELDLVGGIAVELPAARLEKLSQFPGLVITPDSPVRLAADGFVLGKYSSKQLWPLESGNALLWNDDERSYAGKLPAIAIIDSGVDTTRADLAGRVVADVKINGDGPGDSRGHGTFVAGIAAGAAPGYAGAAPTAPIVSLDVMDDTGMASTSDVIAAAQWALANKDKYNIRVANFSLHSARYASFRWDPLNKAVQKLWFGGITVVAAAGNYGKADGPSGLPHAPGNDPFIITVGALDLGGTLRPRDDSMASWSAWGNTLDGFRKPEIVAAGRYMIGPVPVSSTLVTERPDKVVAPGYIQLSGTSFAAPVVSGSVAQILARHPDWTPDQVKGALMLTARGVDGAVEGSFGVGQITATKAAALKSTPPNPNVVLNGFLVPDPSGGSVPVFDDAAWANLATSNAAWNSAAWSSAAWSSAAWSSAAWSSAAWATAAWSSAAWSNAAEADAAWANAAWADVSHEDAAAGDPALDGGYVGSELSEAEALADPDLNPVVEEPAAPAAPADATSATTTVTSTTTTITSTLP
jgi:serine protease AprX